MKRIFIMLLIYTTAVYSADESEVRYKSVSLGINYDELRLASEEKIMPVYTELKYYFPVKSSYAPFIKTEFGFNYIEDKEDGEEVEDFFENNYYGVGAGVNIGGIIMEVIFANYNLEYKNENNPISETRLLLKVKYRY